MGGRSASQQELEGVGALADPMSAAAGTKSRQPPPVLTKKLSQRRLARSQAAAQSTAIIHDDDRRRSKSPAAFDLSRMDDDLGTETIHRFEEGVDEETPPHDLLEAGKEDDEPEGVVSSEYGETLRADSKMRMSISLLEEASVGVPKSVVASPATVTSFGFTESAATSISSSPRLVRPTLRAPTDGGDAARALSTSLLKRIIAMVMHTSPQTAKSCLYLSRHWSLAAARAIYASPNLGRSNTFNQLVSTVLNPASIHPYAAFVVSLRLNRELTDDLHLGDLDIALQLFPNLTRLETLGPCATVTNVFLQSVTDHCAAHLRHLSLPGCPITDALLPTLVSSCTHIRSLDLSSTRVTVHAILLLLPAQNLSNLNLDDALPSSKPIPATIVSVTRLRHVTIRNSGLTDPHLRLITLSSPQLAMLDVSGSAALTDDSMIPLLHTAIVKLDVSHLPLLTDLGLHAISRCGNSLTHLTMAGCDLLTPAGVELVARGCQKLECLVMHGCANLLGSKVSVFADRGVGVECVVRGDGIALLRRGLEGTKISKGAGVVSDEMVGVAVQTDVGEGAWWIAPPAAAALNEENLKRSSVASSVDSFTSRAETPTRIPTPTRLTSIMQGSQSPQQLQQQQQRKVVIGVRSQLPVTPTKSSIPTVSRLPTRTSSSTTPMKPSASLSTPNLSSTVRRSVTFGASASSTPSLVDSYKPRQARKFNTEGDPAVPLSRRPTGIKSTTASPAATVTAGRSTVILSSTPLNRRPSRESLLPTSSKRNSRETLLPTPTRTQPRSLSAARPARDEAFEAFKEGLPDAGAAFVRARSASGGVVGGVSRDGWISGGTQFDESATTRWSLSARATPSAGSGSLGRRSGTAAIAGRK